MLINIAENAKYEYLKVTPELIKKNDKEFGRLGISPFIEEEEIKQNRITVKYDFFESIKLSEKLRSRICSLEFKYISGNTFISSIAI